MEQLHKQGRVRAIGVSNFNAHHLKTLMASSEIMPAVNQIEYHPHLQQPELHAFCREHGIAVEGWSPLMQGKINEVPELKQIGEAHDKSAAQVTLRWQLQRNAIVIPKSVHKNRIEENAHLFNFILTDAEIAVIESLDQNTRLGPDPDTFMLGAENA